MSMIACSRSICVSVCVDNIFKFKVWQYSRENVKEAAKPRTEPCVDFESLDVGRAVLEGFDELSVRTLVQQSSKQVKITQTVVK